MSGQHNGPYDNQAAPGTMGSLVNSVDSYLNEFTNGQGSNNTIPQQRGQSLQHHNMSYRYYGNDNYAARRQSGNEQGIVDSAKYYSATAPYYENHMYLDYQVRRTPPGSPSARHAYQYMQQQQPLPQQQPPQQQYPTAAYYNTQQQPAAAYPPPPVGYSRTSSEEYAAQSYRPVYGNSDSSTSTYTPSSYYSSSISNATHHRRTPSSLKMTITTIERPKYTIPDSIDTSNLGGKNGDPGFVPVSPDSSDEEEYFAFHHGNSVTAINTTTTVNNNNYAAATVDDQPPPTPVHRLEPRAADNELEVKETQVSAVSQNQQHQQEDGQQVVPEQDPHPDKQEHRNSTMSRLQVADTDYSLLSALSDAVKKKIKALENVRELFCANEYPESFTGQEVVKALRETLAHKNIPDGYCILIANALMHAKPALFQPVHYNHKSLITGVVYNSPDEIYTFDEDASDDDVPNGVFTSLTRCYTYGCEPGEGGCYAPKCPNKPSVFEEEIMTHANLSRQSSVESLAPVDSDKSYPHIPWSARVPRELLESVSKRERDRQEAINEMIYSEESYRDDLDTMHEVIVQPLAESNIIEPSRRKQFIKQVFNNYEELREISHALFKDLLDLQRRFDQKCVPMIGDILVQHFAYFEKPFISYTPRVKLAEYLVNIEKRNNPEFARFIAEVEKNSRMKRLAFRHFLLNPVTRMQRYPLLLKPIIKKTDEDHPDYAYLVRCNEVVSAIAAKSDAQAAVFEQHVEILKIDDMLTSRQGESHDLQLKDPHRKLYHQGDLKRRSQGIEMTERSDIHAFVFDHLFLMTKIRKTNSGDEYRIWKRPIPLQMLFVQIGSDYAGQSSSSRSPLPSTSSSYMLQGVSLTLQHLGQRDGTYHFFCASPEEKQKWVKAIEDAKAALKKRQGENDVYELRVLDDSSFRYFAAAGVGNQARINCSVPFMSAQGDYKLVIGTDIGVYVMTVGQNDASRVIICDNVTQVAIMERHHILLVLADKTLRAYPLDSVKSNTPTSGPSQELAQSVTFFQVGYCNNRHLVVYRRKKGTSSFFVALEPACDLRDPRNVKLLTQRTGFLGRGSSHSWFKKYKDFYVGAEASNIHFLKSKVSVVVDSRGFEIIDPENLGVGGRNIPDSADPQFNFVQRHTEPLKPLAMYRIQDKFLLCYNRFAFYVNNRNGSLVNRGAGRSPLLCAWEGTPDHVVYQHPYIIAIDSHFIEVRKVDTGELAQIIPGENIRLTYYNGGETPVIHGCMTHPQRPDMQVLFQLWLSRPQRSATANSASSSSLSSSSGYPRR